MQADEQELASALLSTPARLAMELQRLAAETSGQVVLLIDQLEELYALVDSNETRHAFLAAICGAADDPSERVRVILTLRDDFLGKLGETPAARRMLGRITLLRSPGEASLREIVARPVELAGYRYEDERLVGDMLDAVGGEPACLPLLQFACSQLWEGRDKTERVLLRATYESMGGVEGALARHADGVLDGMTPQQTRDAKQLLLRLVTPEGTRRTVRRAGLLDGLGADGATVLDRLVESRVVVSRKGMGESERGVIELAHESLIRNWDRLERWIEEGREEIAFLAEAGQAADLWDKRGRPREEVWRGDALQTARRRAGQLAVLPNLVREFLEAGLSAEHRAQRRKRLAATIGVVALCAVASAAVVVSLTLRAREQTAVREKANAERKRAEALFEAARAAVERSDPVAARAQLRASLELDDSLSARALWPDARHPQSMWSIDVGSPGYGVAGLPDGKSIAVVGPWDGFLVDLTTLEVTRAPALGGSYSIDVCADGATLVVGGMDGGVNALRLPAGPVKVLGRLDGVVRSVACSGDSRYVVASGEKEVRAWEVAGGPSSLLGPCETRCPVAASTRDLAYSSGDRLYVRAFGVRGPGRLLVSRVGGFSRLRMDEAGTSLAAQSPDGVVSVWDMPAAKLRFSAPWNPTAVSALAMTPGGEFVGTCDESECAVWRARTGETSARRGLPAVPFPRAADFVPEQGAMVFAPDGVTKIFVWPWLNRPRESVGAWTPSSVLFSPSGSEVACGDQNIGVVIRSVATAKPIRTLPTRAFSLSQGPDGKRLFVGSVDGSVQAWDLLRGQRLGSISAHRGHAYSVDVRPAGDLLASSGVDGNVRLIRAATLELVGAPMKHQSGVVSVAFSPDGRKLVSASWDRTVKVWDVATQRLDVSLPIEALGMVARFSPDGSLLASSMRGATGVVIWRTDDWSRVSSPPAPGTNNVYGLAFHPDGKRVMLGSADAVGRIWDFRSGKTVELVGHHDGISEVRFSPDGLLASTTSDDGTTRTWETDTGHPFWRAPLVLPYPPRALTQQGWVHLADENAAPTPAATGWARAVHESAREASADTPLTHVCFRSHGSELRIWDTAADRQALVLPLPGLSQVAATPVGCAVLAADEARLVTAAGVSTLLASGATAIAFDHGELLVASGNEVVAFDAAGRRVGAWPSGSGVSSMARIADWLVVGKHDGQISLVALARGRPPGAASFEGLMSSPVLRLAEGPQDTIVAGHRNGMVGVWDPITGRRLDIWHLHGPVVHVLMEGTKLYAVTELADTLTEDLSMLERDYCDLMREIWKIVPVVWEGGKPVKREPPAGHRCLL